MHKPLAVDAPFLVDWIHSSIALSGFVVLHSLLSTRRRLCSVTTTTVESCREFLFRVAVCTSQYCNSERKNELTVTSNKEEEEEAGKREMSSVFTIILL